MISKLLTLLHFSYFKKVRYRNGTGIENCYRLSLYFDRILSISKIDIFGQGLFLPTREYISSNFCFFLISSNMLLQNSDKNLIYI